MVLKTMPHHTLATGRMPSDTFRNVRERMNDLQVVRGPAGAAARG